MRPGIVQRVRHRLVDQHIRGLELRDILAHVIVGQLIFVCVDDLAEILALERGLCDDGKIPRGGVVALVVQTVGIVEMRVGAAELIGPLVHHAYKIRHRARDMLRNDVARVVSRDDHHAVQQILQRHLLAHHQTGHAGILVQIGQRGFRDRHDVGQVPVLQRDQAGHDLGEARGIDPLVGVLLIDDTVRVEVDEQRGLGRHGKLLPG